VDLRIFATCGLGLEELLEGELAALGYSAERERGAVAFRGGWPDVWRANWRLRTTNRVLVELGSWPAADGEALAAGARALASGELAALLHPDRSFAIAATASASTIRDAQWAALKTKDGIADGQRERWGRRGHVLRKAPDLPLRLRLHRDRATLLLDSSGEPLDHRGYRERTTTSPVREQLAAACILTSGWDGRGTVVDPMCGSGTLLAEAGWIARGTPPAVLRERFAFEGFPDFDRAAFEAIRAEPLPAPGPDVRLLGNDHDPRAVESARSNLARAGLADCTTIQQGDAFALEPPQDSSGLVAVNPPYGERAEDTPEQWRALGDLLKRRFRGWRAVVLAGGTTLGKEIGLKPKRRIPVWNGPLEARILVFELY
jgi:23S rRNA G2445 N2-methylase RlmL